MHQANKHNGEMYILHPLEVMRVFSTPGLMIVAILHDVVEDTNVTLGNIYDEFGVEIGDAIDAITHRDGETNKEYWMRCAENDLAFNVKCQDIYVNQKRNPGIADKDTRERLAKKYQDAKHYIRKYRHRVTARGTV
jgi:(p)ppGpp synthase/HD superfamily hydrolase